MTDKNQIFSTEKGFSEINPTISAAYEKARALGMVLPPSKCPLCHDTGYITHGYIGKDGYVYKGISRCHRPRPEKCGRKFDRPAWNCETCGSPIDINESNLYHSKCSNPDCKHGGGHPVRSRIPIYSELFAPNEEFIGEMLLRFVGWKLRDGVLYGNGKKFNYSEKIKQIQSGR